MSARKDSNTRNVSSTTYQYSAQYQQSVLIAVLMQNDSNVRLQDQQNRPV